MFSTCPILFVVACSDGIIQSYGSKAGDQRDGCGGIGLERFSEGCIRLRHILRREPVHGERRKARSEFGDVLDQDLPGLCRSKLLQTSKSLLSERDRPVPEREFCPTFRNQKRLGSLNDTSQHGNHFGASHQAPFPREQLGLVRFG